MRSRKTSWAEHHARYLRMWKEVVGKIAKAAKELIPEAKVYVIGSVAEGRTTIMSDVDVLICVPEKYKKREVKKKIIFKAIEEYGVPWDYPFEIHFHDYGTCEEVLSLGGYVEIDP
ncbi:MAG: hypothetical protein GXO07_07090 [Crenarchaeota archaeon]|nr:hypothetical protein [Thermoproteota archaeon]